MAALNDGRRRLDSICEELLCAGIEDEVLIGLRCRDTRPSGPRSIGVTEFSRNTSS